MAGEQGSAQPGIFASDHDSGHFIEATLPEDLSRQALGDLLGKLGARATPPPGAPAAEAATVTIALGPRLVASTGWDLPSPALAFEAFDSGEHQAPATQRDLLVWIVGRGRSVVTDQVLRASAVLAAAGARIDLDLAGFLYHDSRDLIGFVDGSGNPKGDKRAEVALVSSGPSAGGSFVMTQKWVHDLKSFEALSQDEQERVIGRTKPDSIEFDADDMPARSHVERTDYEHDGRAVKQWRQSMPFGGASEHGLMFLAFAHDPENHRLLLGRMYDTEDSDHLLRYSRPTTGSYYYAPSQAQLQGL